ncbi:amino acid adenylation domain-containing protein [Wukongibacter sp. M2B1]|uniref:amino acid adenylation domain-containing protein n=1 Tax=Wukongibacter sp. M2B1 TaxID=3088895 RepID=UPI003D7A09B7
MSIKKNNVKDIYSLAPMQEGMLYHTLLDKKSNAYFEQMDISIEGSLDVECMERSFNSIIERYDVFRTIFVHEKVRTPMQVVMRERRLKIDFKDVTDLSYEYKEGFIEEFKAKDREKGFNLSRDMLMRVSILRIDNNLYRLIWSFHHIIMDGWCLGIILKDLFEIYGALRNDRVPSLEKVYPYSSYIKWLEESDRKEAAEYWKQYLQEYEQKAGPPELKVSYVKKEYEQLNHSFKIVENISNSLEEIARKNNTTLSTVMQAVWGILLQRYNNTDDVVFGAVVSGRPSEVKGIERMVGLFINTVPVRVKSDGGKLFSKLLEDLGEDALQREKYSYYPLVEIQSMTSLKGDLINNIMVFENYPIDEAISHNEDTGFRIIGSEMFEQTSYDFNVMVMPGKELSVKFSYNGLMYDKEFVKEIEGHFKAVIDEIVGNDNIPVKDINILTGEEKRQLLIDFNDTKREYTRDRTIHELFEEQVERSPNNVAVVFDDKKLTYRELNERSNQLARVLRKRGVGPETIVGIMVERSIEMIVGILGILKAGGAYLPIDPGYPEERIRFVLEDSKVDIVLTHHHFENSIEISAEVIDLDDKTLYIGDDSNLEKLNSSNNLAYVIYTSGSTGMPKGTMIEHYSLVNRLRWMQRKYPIGEEDVILQKTPYTFDVSVWELLWWAIQGSKVCLLIPDGEKDPKIIVEAIEKNKVTTMHFVPSMLNIFLEYIKGIELRKLKSLKQVICSGEALTVQQVNRFNKILNYKNYTKLHNLYGPTEATIDVTYFDCPEGENHRNIPIGKPIDNINLHIVDINNKLQPIGVAGELCIGGDGLARGYLNREELTAEKFVENPFVTGERMYRTGDLARWLPDGNIEFLGRIDNQVKIRGFRIEPGEIEAQLLKHGSVKEAVVIDRKGKDNDKYLCAYIVSEEEISVSDLRKHLSKELPEYMVPSYFVQLEKIPLTPNGKIDRRSLPLPEGNISTGVEYEAPSSITEEKLVEIWKEILGIEKIGINDNFFSLGGHSLRAAAMVSKIHKEMNVEVPLREVFRLATVKSLAKYIKEAKSSIYIGIQPVEKKEYYLLSSAQKRLYVLNQLEGRGIGYNMPSAMLLRGDIDKERIEETFRKLVKRHEALRTYFKLVEGEPMQVVEEEVEFKVETRSKGKERVDDIVREFIRPFELDKAPLFRVGMIEISENEHILMLDMHHIISDGVSSNILTREFTSQYEGKKLPELKIQYKDFTKWQNDLLKGEAIKKQEEYWLEVFSGEIPVLNMPTDYPRPSLQSFKGDRMGFKIDEGLVRDLRSIAAETGSTMYMVILAAYNVLLSKYSGQEDIVVGSTIAGRPHPDLEGIMGMFVNTLAMRNQAKGEKSFREFLLEVKEKALKAYENQDYQFEELVEKLSIPRDMSRNPLFDTMFTMQNIESEELKIEDVKFETYGIENKAAKFDLTLSAVEAGEIIEFDLEYCTELYKKETIQRLSRHFKNILRKIAENPEESIDQIDMLTEEEKRQLLIDFNDTKREYPRDKTIHELFEEQVEKSPDNIALIFEDKEVTYRELNERSNQLARVLRKRGVGPETIVGIMVERSIEMIVGILGILKAGGAYLPIDPEYPEERIMFMLEDGRVNMVLTQDFLVDNQKYNCKIINLNDRMLYQGERQNFEVVNNPNNLAYVMYTSGSTGKPKGVIVEHKNVVRLVKNTNYINFMQGDCILQTGALTFDASTFEIWGTLLNGLSLYMVNKSIILDANKLANVLNEYKITTIWLTSSLFNQLSKGNPEMFSPVKNLLVGGDVLSLQHINEVRNRCSKLNIINGYGPTENTTFSICFRIDKEYSENIPIGKPISNSSAYILDNHNNIQPIGVAGELCVGGDGVARGYLNREELTSEKFVENPFVPGERMYRTGDLARWLPDGNIEFLGRIDHQVKIRGFRIEPGEIEAQLLKHGSVKEAVVIDRKGKDNDKYLCAYIVSEEEISVSDLRKHLSKELPEYMVPSYFVQLEKIPLTPNGKIDRRSLPLPEGNISTGVEYEAPSSITEEKLVEIWKEILGIEKIGINDNFFSLGGHSLRAAAMVSKIHKEMNVEVPLREVFRLATVKSLAKYIKEAKSSIYIGIQPVEKKEYYLLSSAQKRLYVLNQLEGRGIGYNMPSAMLLRGDIDKERIEETFRKLVKRHEALRTYFKLVEGEPMQVVEEEVEFKVETRSKGKERVDDIVREFIRPFELDKAPLFRVGMIEISENEHILMLDMHHIISDGVSSNILTREFTSQYEGKKLPELKIQYKDFTKWQNDLLKGEAIKKQEEYWLEVFSGEIPVLNMPTDYPRPSLQSFKGDRMGFKIDEGLVRDLRSIAAETGSTMYMVILAAYNVLLSKYSGQEDIVVGSTIAGRPHPDLEGIMGMFVNTLAMRNQAKGEKSFREFLLEVKEKALKVYENQDYQFEELVEKLSIPRDMSRNPLFDTMFTMQNIESEELKIEDVKFETYGIENKAAKFDLTLSAVEAGEIIEFDLEYCTELYKKETIQRLSRHFKNILRKIAENPEESIDQIDMLTEEEKRQLLIDFNDTKREYPRDKTIHELFEEQVEKSPDNIALIFEDKEVTYRELNERSNQLARVLRKRGVGPETIVGIMVERSIEMIVGILGILKSGGAYLPIDPEYPEERIEFILEDSAVNILLTQKSTSNQLSYRGEILQFKNGMEYEEVDSSSLEIINRSNNLAYIIYTSGSTGNPKGVMIEHRTIINTLLWRKNYYIFNQDDTILQIPSFSFDSSIEDIFTPLISGSKVIMISQDQRFNIHYLKEVIVKNKITHFLITPVLYKAFLEEAPRSLNGLRIVTVAGDSFTEEFVKRHFEKLKNVRLVNEYGPTENSVCSTVYEFNKNDTEVKIGKPINNVKCYILDESKNLSPTKISGELCIGGDGLARGYLNREELTAEKFVENPFVPGERMYRTGDLARWLPDGNIEFLGRIDHQVKIRGFRIEPGEIEAQLLKHGSVKEAVVIDRKGKDNDKYLCAYIVSEEEISVSDLRKHLSKELPEYMVPSYFVQLEKISLTPNGKIDRRSLPLPEGNISTGVEYEAPSSITEEKLVEIWKEILGIEKIGINDNFFSLGGHSLRAAAMVSKIHKEMNVEVPLREVFRLATVKSLAKYIKEAKSSIYIGIQPVEKKEYYLLSSAQKRLYVLNQLEGRGIGYNMPSAMLLRGDIDKERIEETFRKLVKRHEALRTYFKLVEGEPMQVVEEEVEFKVETRSKGKERVDDIVREFIRPFELDKAPLFRVGMIEISENEHILMLDMHHIISDGVSSNILTREFTSQYEGKKLPELKIQYKDFTKWQNDLLKGEAIKKQEEYWLEVFSGEIPVLNMPTDYPRPSLQSFKGDRMGFKIDEGLVRDLRSIAAETGSTMYMVILAAYNVLLSKYSGQEDIVVGSTIAGRPHPDLEEIMGMFVNILAMRNQAKGEKSFREFLLEVKEKALKAYENQDYQFEELVEKLSIPRDMSRNPLFDTMFTMQNIESEELKIEDVKFETYGIENKAAKFDLTLSAVEAGEIIEFDLEYCTELYKKETIQRLSRHFKNILRKIAENPEESIDQIDMLTEEEKRQLLIDFNDTKREYPRDKTIHELFEEQVEKSPDNIALIFEDKEVTYRELNERSNQLARVLRKRGVGPETIVGIMVERSIEMIVGILGILKAGGAYLPIDPEYPEERIEFMLEDSASNILLAEKQMKNRVRPRENNSIDIIDLKDKTLYQGHGDNLKSVSKSSDIAYIIYTSGSTGKPKGTMIRHFSVINILKALHNKYPLKATDAYLLKTAFTFDVSVAELFGWFHDGGKLAILEAGAEKNPKNIIRTIDRNKVTHINFTPSMLNLFIDTLDNNSIEIINKLKYVFVAGEAISRKLVKKFYKLVNNVVFENIYGPTESTIYTTSYSLENFKDEVSVPMGKPLPNVSVYILGMANNIQPIGVAGELCIAGDGVAKGYLNRPELTREKFVPNPFVPGEIMYRTGDLVRWLSDGNIEFLGRIDNQVKIRGFRIELGEIESQLLSHKLIKEALVTDIRDEDGDKYLCAYIVAEDQLVVSELRKHLSKELPQYMIPSYFIQLEKMPLTHNDKINRRALPKPDGNINREIKYVAPRNEMEEKMTAIWREILGLDRVGINDDFFYIGGNSLKTISLEARIYKEFDIEAPIERIFKTPTIREIVEYIINVQKYTENMFIKRPMMLLNEKKGKNIFAFPPLLGYTVCYSYVAKLIDDYSFYAFDFIEDDKKIEKYVDFIIESQKEGPYLLMGYSAGGNLAFEVAKELTKRGFEVSSIIMIDSYRLFEKHDEGEEKDNRELTQQMISTYFNGFEDYKEGIMNIDTIINRVIGRVDSYNKYLNNLINHGKIKANIYLIKSTEEGTLDDKEMWEWGTEGTVKIYQGAGAHIEMLTSIKDRSHNASVINDVLADIEK